MVPAPLGALQVFVYRRVLALRPEEHPIQDFALAIPQMFNVARRLAVREEPVVSLTPVQVEIRKRVRTSSPPSSVLVKLT